MPGRTSPFDAIALGRIAAQHLESERLKTPGELVSWFGAVQAQDYAGAKWAVAQRLRGVTDEAMDRAVAAGEILRTHVLRPTWHFVHPADIRWMLALTSRRVHAANGYQGKKLGLAASAFAKSNAALAKALRGGTAMTRPELAEVIGRAGIACASPAHVNCLVMQAELDAILCSGPLRGRQHTYALLEERAAPRTRTLDRVAALRELTVRYFQSHGPATERDFAWWSGLTLTEAREGVRSAGRKLAPTEVGEKVYFCARDARPSAERAREHLWLLPNYDEYIVAYADRDDLLRDVRADRLDGRENALFHNTLVVAGRVRGRWSRALTKREVALDVVSFAPLTRANAARLEKAADTYGAFHGMPAYLTLERGSPEQKSL